MNCGRGVEVAVENRWTTSVSARFREGSVTPRLWRKIGEHSGSLVYPNVTHRSGAVTPAGERRARASLTRAWTEASMDGSSR